MEIVRHSPALVGVHYQSLRHLVSGSSEGGEEENPGLVSEDPTSHELLSREVHPVPQWENQGDVCVPVERGQLGLLQRAGDQNHRGPGGVTQLGIHRLHFLLEDLEHLEIKDRLEHLDHLETKDRLKQLDLLEIKEASLSA